MTRFLIEVPHESDTLACARAIHVFLSTGSHFLSRADWGCLDGVHSAWMIVDVESKAEALAIVPPAFRANARIVGLNYFTMDQIEPILRRHEAREASGRGPADV
ncbi:MAG TPA: hypothetical protein VI792_02830 [Candidatus Eisenbacteria bacterium]